MSKNFVPPKTVIDKARDLAKTHGVRETEPADQDPGPYRTPPDGVNGFHVQFGVMSERGSGVEFVRIFRGGVRTGNEYPGSKDVFYAVFKAGREDDPHLLRCSFDPQHDWRTDFLATK